MNIISNKRFMCFNLYKNRWMPFKLNSVLIVKDLVYKCEPCECTQEDSLVISIDKGYFEIRTDDQNLVIDEADWNSYICILDKKSPLSAVQSEQNQEEK